VTLEEIASTIEGVVLTGDGKLEIEKAVATDLMSDVLAFAEPGSF